MKWKKLGKLFDPRKHQLANNCTEYAQSPQAIVFDTFIRIYFSTRARDTSGKFLSHVSFVDFDKEFKKTIQVAPKTVIPLGDLGCFDEHGIFPFSIVKEGNKIRAYTSGWNRKVSVSVDTAIGLAYSTDNGVTFKKEGTGPIMTASLHEPFLVCDAFVRFFKSKYHMWYIYGKRWIDSTDNEEPQRVYKIAHACSDDGIVWERDGKEIISDTLNKDECQALPTVIEIDKHYHMFFCYRDAFGFRTDKNKAYRIGHAHSKDLKNWIRNDHQIPIDVSENEWDSDMMCYPNVFQLENQIYMLYNGNTFGKTGFGLAILET
jgi:sucrose-6-phosphate hydrolase SacC (GH32 family)